ncbi:unnamed protein product, partial [Amoebophrya sp. A25]
KEAAQKANVKIGDPCGVTSDATVPWTDIKSPYLRYLGPKGKDRRYVFLDEVSLRRVSLTDEEIRRVASKILIDYSQVNSQDISSADVKQAGASSTSDTAYQIVAGGGDDSSSEGTGQTAAPVSVREQQVVRIGSSQAHGFCQVAGSVHEEGSIFTAGSLVRIKHVQPSRDRSGAPPIVSSSAEEGENNNKKDDHEQWLYVEPVDGGASSNREVPGGKYTTRGAWIKAKDIDAASCHIGLPDGDPEKVEEHEGTLAYMQMDPHYDAAVRGAKDGYDVYRPDNNPGVVIPGTRSLVQQFCTCPKSGRTEPVGYSGAHRPACENGGIAEPGISSHKSRGLLVCATQSQSSSGGPQDISIPQDEADAHKRQEHRRKAKGELGNRPAAMVEEKWTKKVLEGEPACVSVLRFDPASNGGERSSFDVTLRNAYENPRAAFDSLDGDAQKKALLSYLSATGVVRGEDLHVEHDSAMENPFGASNDGENSELVKEAKRAIASTVLQNATRCLHTAETFLSTAGDTAALPWDAELHRLNIPKRGSTLMTPLMPKGSLGDSAHTKALSLMEQLVAQIKSAVSFVRGQEEALRQDEGAPADAKAE